MEHKELSPTAASPKSSDIAVAPAPEPTTKEELYAWWAYFVGYEPISVVVLTLLLPLVTDSVSRAVGHVRGQPGVSCSDRDLDGLTCTLFNWGGVEISTTVFTYIVIGVSALVQAAVFVSVGALADHGNLRKQLLAISTAGGVVSTCAIYLIYKPSLYWLAAVLVVVISLFSGMTLVFYNSYLPLLAQNHPEYLEAVDAETKALEALERPGEDEAQQGSPSSGEERARAEHHRMLAAEATVKVGERISSWISTVGFMSGYFAGLVLLAASAGFLALAKGVIEPPSRAVRMCIVAMGAWWGLVGGAAVWRLRYRPGPPLPANSGSYVVYSWRKVRQTLAKAQQLPHTFRYLVCYFFFSDGFNTMGSAAVVFCRSHIDVGEDTLVLGVALSLVFAIGGNFALMRLQSRYRWSSKHIMVGMLLALSLLPVYGSLGLFTRRLGFHHAWEVIPMSIYYGTFVGAIQSFSRVLFADLIPEGEEAEFFSLYAITDKGSSWIGPIVVASINAVADGRYGLLFLALMVVLPLPLLVITVDPVQGKRDCIDFAKRRRAAMAASDAAA